MDSETTTTTVTEVTPQPTVEQTAAHAADPAANPLPEKTVIITTGVASRLPAGSTLEVQPGLHVPHPHAEVNLPGKPDPRVGVTAAVTESLVPDSVADDTVSKPLGKLTGLHDSVRPSTLKVAVDADPESGKPAEVVSAKQ